MTRRFLALLLAAAALTATPATAEVPAGAVLYHESGGEVWLLLAEHARGNRGWAGFGGGELEGETVAQTAARKSHEEARGYWETADLLARIGDQQPVMDGPFANYFIEVDFVPAQRVTNHAVPDSNDAYLERGRFAWIPWSVVEPLVQQEIDRSTRHEIPAEWLPAGSRTTWFWSIWLGNMRKAIVADALPWGAQ
jgi:ADP-ribose pyrophosphatase YjhB (NUDIX family)